MTRQVLTKNENYLKNLSQISQLKFLETSQAPSQCAVAVVDDLEVFVPFQQLFDITQERARMEKEIAKARQELSAFEGKLANKNFVERAPKEVVEKEKLRFKEHQERLNKLQSALEQLK